MGKGKKKKKVFSSLFISSLPKPKQVSVGLNIITKGESARRRQLDNNSQQSWNLRTGAGAAGGPMDPTNLSHDVEQRPHIHPLSGRALAETGCQDGRPRHRGCPGNQALFLTAAFVGRQPRETKCHFLPLCKHMHNILLLAYHHELAITALLGGRAAADDKASQILVCHPEPPSSGFFHLGLDLFS